MSILEQEVLAFEGILAEREAEALADAPSWTLEPEPEQLAFEFYAIPF